MTGFRGGYRPFYDAVRELSARDIFNAAEVSAVPGANKIPIGNIVGARDEYRVNFIDGYYPACTYRVDGGIITIADDSITGLYVEQFDITGGQIRQLDDTGICRLHIMAGGRYAYIQSGDPKIGRQFRVNIRRIDDAAIPNNGGTERHALRTTSPQIGTENKRAGAVDNKQPRRRYELSSGYKANRRS